MPITAGPQIVVLGGGFGGLEAAFYLRWPLYELVFMLDTWLRRNRGRAPVDITWTTYEQSYIQAFGPRLHDVASGEFRERGIAGYPGYSVERVVPGEVRYTNGKRDAGQGGVRSGQHVRHGAVRQGDIRPGAAPPDRQPGEADRGAA